jgi:soluble lytic murein transglycosylase-like protein
LILLAVSAVITTAVPVYAETIRLATLDEAVRATKTTTSRASKSVRFKKRATLGSCRDERAYSREIAEAATRYAVPERLIWAVIRAESGFEPRAVSRRGARGLMQLMPETAAILGVRDAFNPRENINGGVRHLRALIERFANNMSFAVAAYNAGETAVLAYRGIPPYRETQEYVTRVMLFYSTPATVLEFPAGVHQVVERDGTILYTNIPRTRWQRTRS